MKSTLYFLLLMLGAGTVAAQEAAKPSTAALDDKYGFRDARFETDTTAFKDLHRMSGNPSGIEAYWRDSAPQTIGEAHIKETAYFFYKGKFLGVLLTTDGASDSQALLRALNASYGDGKAISAYQFEWVTKRVAMSFRQKPVSGVAETFIISQVMKAQQDADNAVKAKKAAGDL
jgi:hypothetical protein